MFLQLSLQHCVDCSGCSCAPGVGFSDLSCQPNVDFSYSSCIPRVCAFKSKFPHDVLVFQMFPFQRALDCSDCSCLPCVEVSDVAVHLKVIL